MIAGERRRRAVGVVASLLLHGLAVLASVGGREEAIVDAASPETILVVTYWTGDDGRGATSTSPAPPLDTPPLDTPPAVGEPALAAAPTAQDVSREPVETREASQPPDEASRREDVPPQSPESRGSVVEDHGTVAEPAVPTIDGSTPEATRRRPAPEVEARRPARDTRRRSGQSAPRQGADRVERRTSGVAAPARADGSAAASAGPRRTPSAAAAGGRPGSPGPRAAGGSSSDLAAYLSRVRARISSHQSPLGGEQGRVSIRFDVVGDGSFTGLAVASGGAGPLADVALRVVRRASPAPPIPPSLGRDRIPMNVTIVFE